VFFFCPLFFLLPRSVLPLKREERPPPRRASLPLSLLAVIGGLAPRRYSLYARAVHSRVPSRYYFARPVRVQCGCSMSVTPDGIRHVVPCFVVYGVSPVIFFIFFLRISKKISNFARKIVWGPQRTLTECIRWGSVVHDESSYDRCIGSRTKS